MLAFKPSVGHCLWYQTRKQREEDTRCRAKLPEGLLHSPSPKTSRRPAMEVDDDTRNSCADHYLAPRTGGSFFATFFQKKQRMMRSALNLAFSSTFDKELTRRSQHQKRRGKSRQLKLQGRR
ncbi:MAG: hypothetical protein R3C24_05410 [Cyanobacteriota/Melainabacteria group bacterium]